MCAASAQSVDILYHVRSALATIFQRASRMIYTACKICGQNLKKMTASHLKKHGRTIDDYERTYFPDKHRYGFLAGFLFERYVSVVGRWVQYDLRHKRAFTVSPDFEKKSNDWPVEDVRRAEGILNSGVHDSSQRHDAVMFVADYLKSVKNMSSSKVVKFLVKWAQDKWAKGLFDRDADKMIAKTFKRSWALCKSDLIHHTEGRKGIGVYFAQKATKFIGLDVDTTDLEILRKVYDAVIRLGVPQESILCSFSGKKGYHVDIFLNAYVSKLVAKKFHEVLLVEADVTSKQVELRGGGDQAYKLPFGHHYETGNYCYAVDENGKEISNDEIIDYLRQIKPVAPIVVCDAVDINYSIVDDAEIAFEDLQESVVKLPKHSNTNENDIDQVERLLKSGVHEVGRRNKAILLVSSYFKDVKELSLDQTIDCLVKWVKASWAKGIVDRDLIRQIKDVAKSVYKTDYRFSTKARRVKIYAPDIHEIMSVEVNHSARTSALRRLYFALLIHSRAYAGADGRFYMTYEQLGNMGAGCDRSAVYKNIQDLVKMGKVEIVRSGEKIEHSIMKKPNVYRLVKFAAFELDVPGFDLCLRPKLCKECLHAANCTLNNISSDDVDFVACPEKEKAAA